MQNMKEDKDGSNKLESYIYIYIYIFNGKIYSKKAKPRNYKRPKATKTHNHNNPKTDKGLTSHPHSKQKQTHNDTTQNKLETKGGQASTNQHEKHHKQHLILNLINFPYLYIKN